MNIQNWRQFDFSLGVQEATTWMLKKPNELARGINLRFTEKVGGFQRRDGFTQAGDAFATDLPPQGGHVAKFSTGPIRFVAVNNSGGTATIVRTQNSATGAWTTLPTISYPVNSVVFFLDYLDEVYISGFDPATGDPITPYNVDKTLDVSATRNILNCPTCYFFTEYLGLLYAGNVLVNGVRRPDRVYKSSPPLGAMTFVQGAQSDVSTAVTLTDNTPTMTSNTAPFGVAAASTAHASFPAYKGFDDSALIANKWTTNSVTTGWLRYDFGSGNSKIITYYSITAVPSDEPSEADRAPKTWTFEGSPDGTTWTVLETRTNQAIWAAGERRTYSISNTTAYRYYRINVSVNQGDATYLAIAEAEFMTSLTGLKALQLKLDSVRYIKPTMNLDIYRAGTETKLYDITVSTVDKALNTITFIPQTETRATTDFDTSTNAMAVANALLYPTGTPVKFSTTVGLPAPLVADTTYYAIYVDTTHIKFATTYDNASLNNPIDITTTGTGTHYMRLSYQLNDNDEIWLDGTKGKLNIFWNTDYPNPEATGEFLAVKPGTDSSNIVTAVGKSANRLFIFTRNSGSRWDGQNLVVFNNNVGCISHRALANLDDDWLVYMDQKGNIRARNENTGQAENISRGIRNRYLRRLTQAQMKAVSIGVVDNVVKAYLGTINGEYIRVCYDFDANTWSPERLGYPALIQVNDDYSGNLEPYFFSSNGKLYLDENGNLDDTKVIPMEAGTGRDMFQDHRKKRFVGMLLFSANCNGLKIEAAVDGGKMLTIGIIEGTVCYMPFTERGDNALPEGSSIDWQIMGAGKGDPPEVEGAVIFYTPREDVPGERRPV